MRISLFFLLFITLIILSGCSNLRGLKLIAPESFGLTPIKEGIYIEEGADNKVQQKLITDVNKAKSHILKAYGSINSDPSIYACITESCYKSFGGFGSRAKVYGYNILLSPRGLSHHLIAHEWSHAELLERLSFGAWWDIPQWFNEGLAVAISQEPSHSDKHWEFLVNSNIKRPTREQLMSYDSLQDWLDAVKEFGATQNQERIARGEPRIAPLYTAAGQEIRPWLKRFGTKGLINFIEKINNGIDFNTAYAAENREEHAEQLLN